MREAAIRWLADAEKPEANFRVVAPAMLRVASHFETLLARLHSKAAEKAGMIRGYLTGALALEYAPGVDMGQLIVLRTDVRELVRMCSPADPFLEDFDARTAKAMRPLKSCDALSDGTFIAPLPFGFPSYLLGHGEVTQPKLQRGAGAHGRWGGPVPSGPSIVSPSVPGGRAVPELLAWLRARLPQGVPQGTCYGCVFLQSNRHLGLVPLSEQGGDMRHLLASCPNLLALHRHACSVGERR
jgi:hypothetical protein